MTTGIGPDLMTGARTAVSEMIDLLSRRYGYAPVDAYMLCSVCADLRISSIVDVPNWVVSFYFPRIVWSSAFNVGAAAPSEAREPRIRKDMAR